MPYAIEMKGITKKFPKVIANNNVDLSVSWGSIHGLIGENGAGKTTLMKILYGMYLPDEGEIYVNGNKAHISSPKDAIQLGIGMVHQHFTLVPSLTVTQNIILGKPVCKKTGFLDLAEARKLVKSLGEEYGLPVDPDAVIKDLSVAMQQRIEILKVLYLGADILILDEPTAVLTPQEITNLLNALEILKEKGKSIILITHKLKELMKVTDRITVLRNGLVTGELDTKDANEAKIASMMVGKEMDFEVHKNPANPGDVLLQVSHLNYRNKFGVQMINDVSFSVRAGEIVGVAGVQGNGQTELISVLSGMINNYTGSISINNTEIKPDMSPLYRRKTGLGHVPEDRQTTGAALPASLVENFIMGDLSNPEYAKSRTLDYKKAAEITKKQYNKFDVKYGTVLDSASSLSGGNLQKSIVARELYRNPKVLIAAQPSRGVDIGATMFIHEKLVELRDEKNAVLLISSELSEIMSLSDRIIVMYNGRIVGETTPEESNEQQIGLLMAGITKETDTK